ncbi:MAG: GntG family PLP-dependent aldolase [bacterium]
MTARTILSPMKVIDLRSDTVTRPSSEMRQAMFTAEVGDDVFGDDPTVKELENYVAGLFEREAALFVPSGTMGNQVCLKAHSQPGWELLCDRQSHIINYEVAGPVVHSGLLVNLLDTERGTITSDMIRDNIRPVNLHCPLTKLVSLENSHNRHGGTIYDQQEIVRVRKVCDEFDLILHLDGARIWNVHMATGLSLPELTRLFDSISVCLSKGLGAPIGSIVLGSAEFIERCRRIRKLFGGGMRQVGIIAAAGLYAVRHNLERLADDHANARLLAEGLDRIDLFEVDLSRVQTNIVVAKVTGDRTAEVVIQKLKEADVWVVPFGPKQIRMVTHLDVTRADCEEALARIRRTCG